MKNLKLVLFMSIAFTSIACVAQRSRTYDWKEIKEFKFYGRNNPIEMSDSNFVLADVNVASELLTKTKKSSGYFPKGAQSYATITFHDSRVITIQILPGLPAPIRVVEENLFDDRWFKFNEKTALKWLNLINELNEQLTD